MINAIKKNEAAIADMTEPNNSTPARGVISASLWRKRIADIPMTKMISPCGLVTPAKPTEANAPNIIGREFGKKIARLVPTKAAVPIKKKKESAIGQFTRIRMSTENIKSVAVNIVNQDCLRIMCVSAVTDVIANA